MNILDTIGQATMDKVTAERPVPRFEPGDTLRVHVKVQEGNRERIQVYEGLCIARKNAGVNSAFTVRKISFGEGVERVFPLYSPASGKSRWCAKATCAAPSSITCARCAARRAASPRTPRPSAS